MGTTILSVERVEKRFGGINAVSSLSFSVEKGEVLGLMGPNGAGKSTVFNLIAGTHRPDDGTIRFKNKDITGLNPSKICRLGLARTYQIPQPFPKLTVLDNVIVSARFGGGFNKEQAEKKARDLLDWLRLSDKAVTLARDLPVLSLKRLEVARSLAGDPELVLLDEVAAGTTGDDRSLLSDVIEKIRQTGVTVVLVEHGMKFVMDAVDRLIVLDKGSKLAEGLPGEIMENREVITAYFG